MEYLRSFFTDKKDNNRILFLGFPGKTTFLYYSKLGEIVTTIPTVGFNVETVAPFAGYVVKGTSFDCWDVGGCDKIRPLVRHYYDGLRGCLFFLSTKDESYLEYSLELLRDFVYKYSLPQVPTAIFCVQRDLPDCLPEDVVRARVTAVTNDIKDRPVTIFFGSSIGPSCHRAIWEWFASNLSFVPAPPTPAAPIAAASSSSPSSPYDFLKLLPPFSSPPTSPSDALDDDTFLAQISDATLPTWDHKTHLRLAFVVLLKEGRRKAVNKIMDLISNFIKNSPRTNGKTFHVTMTYLWIHLVHFALASSPSMDVSFNDFLQANMWLMNGGLFKFFYSDALLLRNPETRATFAPPDIHPLPNIIPSK